MSSNLLNGLLRAVLVVTVCEAAERALVVYPTVRQRVEPGLPASFRQDHVEAKVLLLALVGKDGYVEEVDVKSCATRAVGEADFAKEPAKRCLPFEEAAKKAVLKWKYIPGTQDGKPIEIYAPVKMDFIRSPKQ